ncbi:MAG TPA: BamA/TamA family outer membrane protein [Polyangiaceae bacterium]|jgi:outer membrane protein insertion porin family/translocation and assembly module TamA
MRPTDRRPSALLAGTLTTLLAPALLGGCSSIPEGRSAIDSVRIVNAGALDGRDVRDKLATTESPKFLGLFRGLFYDYEIFDASMLQRDLARVERYYRGHGFLEAHARAGRVVHSTDGRHVRVEILVDEGAPTIDAGVRVDGLDDVPPAIAADVRSAASSALPRGKRFDEDAYAKAKVAVARALTDRGYAYATAKATAQADVASHTIDYVFTVHAGPQAVFGPVTLVEEANADNKGRPVALDEGLLRRTLNLHPGEPYSTAAIDAATQAMLDLEVLSSVEILPTLTDPTATVVPVLVKWQAGKMHSIRVGGGLEFDEIKTELHGLVSWEDHNFLGNLRDFTIELKPGVVLYPTRVDHFVAPTNPLPEERLRLQLKQPAFPEARTTLVVQPEGNVFPMLVAPDPPAGSPVLGYGELKIAAGLERRFGKRLLVRFVQTFQSEFPFAYTTLPLDQPTPTILLSYPQLVTTLDFRDDPIRTHSGFYLSNDLTSAGGIFGGSATDLRIQPEVRAYIPIARGVTFATRESVGFLFASNYGDYVQNHLTQTLDPPGTGKLLYQAVDRDIELAYFRGFFSGGPSTNRGYPLRGIAPHGVVPFLSPATVGSQAQQAANQGNGVSCFPGQPNYDASQCSIPIGGFTLWEASAEVRFDLSGPLGVATFCDAGDVAPKQAEIRLNHIHLSCGAGGRYDTPVGAIRLDVAYRIVDVIHETAEDAAEEGTQPKIFYVPLAISFGIGEAF